MAAAHRFLCFWRRATRCRWLAERLNLLLHGEESIRGSRKVNCVDPTYFSLVSAKARDVCYMRLLVQT